MFSAGYNLLIYDDVVSRPKGSEAWNNITAQITTIALENPHHFFKRVAEKIIPQDAKRHELHCYFANNNVVLAFAVVSIVAHTAEIVWLACAERVRRQGIASSLMKNVEEEIFTSHDVQTVQVLCCSEDTLYTEGDEVIDGSKWHGTYAFYKSQGYGLYYRLDHYWDECSHAYVYIKKKKNKHGFLLSKTEIDSVSAPKIKSDSNWEINKLIHNHIWNCLDAFDERFVNSIGVTAGNKGATVGITGIIMGSAESNICTIFAQRCKDPIRYSNDMRFEFDMHASMLTLMLKGVEDQQGVMHYEIEYDRYSEIKVAPYFSEYQEIKTLSNSFHVFFAKHKGESNSYAILYFITPSVNDADIVWCLNQWSSLAHYSFSFFLELYGFFLSFQITERVLGTLDYFQKLINSVSPSDAPEAFEEKLIKIKNDIQNRMTRHYHAILSSKESAIIHYGHTLGHRLSPIQAYLEGKKDSLKRAVANAKFLDSLSVVLQAINFSSIDELYRHPKKTRFLKYEREGGSLDIAGKIQNEWTMLVESFQPARVGVGDASQMRVMTLIEFTGNLHDANLDYMLVDSQNGEACRPRESFYSQLFSELLLNVVRHGGIAKNKIDLEAKQVNVQIALTVQQLDHDSKMAPRHCHALTLSNKIGDKVPPPWLSETRWTPWPAYRENDGPGMAIATLRTLRLGELWYRYNPTKRVFRVAVWLKGLRIGAETKI